MKIINHTDIEKLNIPALQYMKWVRCALLKQYECIIPPKISIHLPEEGFFNTMPCYIQSDGVMGVKVVNRFIHNNPALDATIMLYNSTNGELEALMDGSLITTMRTGAVAATSIIELKNPRKVNHLSIIGLGVTARATILCLLESIPNEFFEIKLFRYKEQAELFIKRFEHHPNVRFKIVDRYDDLIVNADIVISCVTSANTIFGQDEWFKEGVLVVPIHTRGFQNCDLFFDKVFGDLTGQISGFKYFDKFKKFEEFAKVIQGKVAGRENEKERILIYNIGIALHDIYIANKISIQTKQANIKKIDFKKQLSKFYI